MLVQGSLNKPRLHIWPLTVVEIQVEHINIGDESEEEEREERFGDIHREWCYIYDEMNQIEEER